ncbi:MAG: azurin [Myxococcota bacterium]
MTQPSLSRRAMTRLLLASPLSTALVGCGGESAGGGGGGAAADTESSFAFEVGDAMAYNITEMRVAAGAEITVSIRHTGQMPKNAMGHNFVLLQQGTNVEAFATKAIAAAEADYIPASESSSIIAHTKLVGGGESDEITFTAPPAGTYTYLCSYPGHYSMMQGSLVSV